MGTVFLSGCNYRGALRIYGYCSGCRGYSKDTLFYLSDCVFCTAVYESVGKKPNPACLKRSA